MDATLVGRRLILQADLAKALLRTVSEGGPADLRTRLVEAAHDLAGAVGDAALTRAILRVESALNAWENFVDGVHVRG